MAGLSSSGSVRTHLSEVQRIEKATHTHGLPPPCIRVRRIPNQPFLGLWAGGGLAGV